MAGFDFILPPDLSKGIASTTSDQANPLPLHTPNTEETVDPASKSTVKNDFDHLIGAVIKPTPNQLTPIYSTANESAKYPNYNPLVNNEELYAQTQSGWSKLVNGVGKAGVFATTTFLQTWLSLPDLLRSTTGENVYKNELAMALDDIRNNAENWLPNYYSEWEKEHPFKSMIPFSGGFANFLGDKFIKNLGFTVGALAGAASQTALIGALTGGVGAVPAVAANVGRASLWMSRILAGSKNAAQTLKAFSVLNKADDVALAINQLRSAAATTALDKIRYGFVLGSATHTEAGIEAREGYEAVKAKLISDYRLEHGYDPVGEDYNKIEATATAAGNTRYVLNAALIGASNVIQFDTLLKTFSATKKALQEGIEIGGRRIGISGEVKTLADIDNLGVLKNKGIWNKVKPVIPNILSEGVWEEGGQFAVQVGTESYFTNKYHNKHKGDLDAVLSETMSALAEQFGSVEGWESMILGALTGAVFSPVSSKVSEVVNKIRTGETEEARLQRMVNNLNTTGITGVFQQNYDAAADAFKQKEDLNEAVESGNIFKYKNIKADNLFNFIISGVTAGRADVRREQLEMLKSLPDDQIQEIFGTDRTNASAYIDKLIDKVDLVENTYKAVSSSYQNPFTFNADATEEAPLAENAAFLQFEEYKRALTYYAFKQEDFKDRIASITQELATISPNGLTTTIQELTNPKTLKEKALQYEEEAASLLSTLEGLSPELKRENIRKATTLKTLAQNIKDTLNNPVWTPEQFVKVFNTTMNYETNGDTQAQAISPLAVAEAITLGHDLNQIDRELDYLDHILNDLNTEAGFQKFMEQYEQWRTELERPYDVVREGPVESVKGQPVGTKFSTGKAPLYTTKKNPSGTYSIIDPVTGEVVSVHPNQSEALKELSFLNEQRAKLDEFTLVQENENGTIRVRDREGNIQDIDPALLNKSKRVKSELEVIQENPNIINQVLEDAKKVGDDLRPTGNPTTENVVGILEGLRKHTHIVPYSTTSPSEVTDTQNTRVRNEQVFLNNFRKFPNRSSIKAIEITKHHEEQLGLKGIVNYVQNRAVNDPTNHPEDVEPVNGVIVVLYVDINTKEIVDLNGKPIRKLDSTDPINYDTIPISVRTSARMVTHGGFSKFQVGAEQEGEALMKAWAEQRKKIFSQTTYTYRPFDFTISRGIPIRGYNRTDSGSTQAKNPVVGTLVTENDLNTPLVQISEGSINFQGESLPIPAGRPVLIKDYVLEHLNNRKLTADEISTIYKVLVQAAKEAYTNKGRINPIYYKYLQGILFFHHKAIKPDLNLSGRNLVQITEDYHLRLGDLQVPFTPEELVANEKAIKDQLSETYNNVSGLLLKENKPFEEVIDVVDGKPVTQLWDSYQHYLLSDKYNVDPSDANYNKPRTDIPLTTSIQPVTEALASNFRGRYITLNEYDMGYQPAAEQSDAPQGGQKPDNQPATSTKPSTEVPQSPVQPAIPEDKVFELPLGKLEFRFTVVNGNYIFDLADIDAFNTLVEFPAIQQKAEAASIPAEDFAKAFLELKAEELIKKLYPPVQAPVQEQPTGTDEVVIPTQTTAAPGTTVTDLDGNTYTVSPDQITTYTTDYGTVSYIQDTEGNLVMVRKPGETAPVQDVLDKDVTKPAPEKRKSLRKYLEAKRGRNGKGPLGKGPDPDVPFRRTLTAQVERMTPEDRKRFKEWHSKNLPKLPFEELDAIITISPNEKAWGMMENGVAKFYKAAERGTEYHETFEQVWAFLLNPEEQAALLEEFRGTTRSWIDRELGTRINSKTATDQQIKERIADDFAEYQLGKMTPKSWIKRLFDRIMNIIRYFVRKPSLKQQLFSRINTGFYKDKGIDPELASNLQPQYARITGFDQETTRLYVGDMFVRLMALLFQDPTKSIYNLADRTAETLFETIKQQYIKEDLYEFLGDQGFAELIEQTKIYLRTFKVVLEQDSPVNAAEHDRNEYAKEAFVVDAKSSAPWPVKLIIASLAKAEALSSMTEIPEVQADTPLGVFEPVDFARAFVTVLSRLSNLPSWNAMLDSLKTLSKENADFVKLFERLKGNRVTGTIDYNNITPSDWRMIVQVFTTFAKQNPTPDTLVLGQESYFVPASYAKPMEVIKEQWYNGIRAAAESDGKVIKLENGVYKLQQYTDKFSTGLQKLKYLNALGIHFPKEVYKKLNPVEQDKLSNLIDNVRKYLGGGKDSLRTLTVKSLAVSASINGIAALYTKAAHVNTDSVYYGPQNKPRTVYENKNAISKFADTFNYVKTLDELLSVMPQLNDPYLTNSVVLSKGGLYFDKEGNRTDVPLEVHTFLSVNDTITEKETLVSRLGASERALAEFLNNLEGRYYALVPADSSTEWATSIGNLIGDRYIDNPTRFYTRYQAVMKGYLKDEIELALSDRSNIRAVGKKAKQLRFFREILDNSTVTQIEDLIAKGDREGIDEYLDTNKASIQQQLRAYLDYYKDRTIKTLRNQDILKRYTETQWAFPSFPVSLEKKYGINKEQMTTEDINRLFSYHAANYIAANMEYHKLLFGEPYSYDIKDRGGKIILDETKRIKTYGSPRGTTFNSSEFNQYHNANLNKVGDIQLTPKDFGYNQFRDYYNSITLKDVSVASSILTDPNTPDDIKELYANNNEADASSWRLISSYRDINMREGTWDYDGNAEKWYQYEMAYTRSQLAKKGKYTYSSKELERADKKTLEGPRPVHFLDVRKPITTGSKYRKEYVDNLIDKTSELPIYYSLVEGRALEDLFIQMFNKDIQHVIVESGRKQGIEDVQSLYNPDGTIADLKPATIQVAWETYGKQVENAYAEKQQTEGSQLTKLATMDLLSNSTPIDYHGEDWATLTEEERLAQSNIYRAVKHNDSLLGELKRLGYNSLLQKLGLEEDIIDGVPSFRIVDGRKLQSTLKDEMTRRELSDNAFESLQWNDETDTFTIPFEASNNYNTIRSILYSIVDKSLVSQKRNGGPKVQVAATLWEDSANGRELLYKEEVNGRKTYKKITREQYSKLTDDQKKNVVLSSSNLKFYTPDAPYCEVLLPNWFADKIRKSPKLRNYSNEQLIEYLNSTKEGQDILFGIGFRIPTQALSSVEVFKVKGFLDASIGNTVVVPSEITTKAGSDFDIDKLNTYLKNVYIDSSGDVKPVPYFEDYDQFAAFAAKVFSDNLEKEHLNTDEEIARAAYLLERVQNVVFGLATEKERIKWIPKIQAMLGDATDTVDLEHSLMQKLENLGKKKEALSDTDVQTAALEVFIDKMYEKSIENEYFRSLQELLQLPENYSRLMNPNNTGDLIPISETLDTLQGYSESDIRTRMLDFTYLNDLRHKFVVAKRWVGIGAVNITGHALAQRTSIIIDPAYVPAEDPYLQVLHIPFPHNTVTINGERYATLSGTHSVDGKYISDKISAYINAFVDVAKDPFIMKIIKSDKVVGVFMLMERLGIPTDTTAFFMNQPIIVDYLKQLETQKSGALIDPAILSLVGDKYGRDAVTGSYDVNDLKSSIQKFAAGQGATQQLKAEQRGYLNTFVQMARLAEYLFDFTQATTYDTTTFRSGDILHKKQLLTEFVGESSVFRTIDNLLDNSFIGNLAEHIHQANRALSTYLSFQQDDIVEVFNDIKYLYLTKKFATEDSILKIAGKLNNTYLSYIVGQEFGLNPALMSGPNSLAKRLQARIANIEGQYLLDNLEVIPARLPGGADLVKLKFQPKTPYEFNLYTEAFRELREDPETNDIYKLLQTIAILQGLNPSPFNLTNIMPLEDSEEGLGYSGIISRALPRLKDPVTLNEFKRERFFERNNWRDPEIVPTVTLNKMVQIPKSSIGADITQLVVSEKASNIIQSPVVKLKRYAKYELDGMTRYRDLLTGQDYTASQVYEQLRTGNVESEQYIGYMREDHLGKPVVEDGVVTYYATNLLGDGLNIVDYQDRPVFNNNTVRLVQPQRKPVTARIDITEVPTYEDILTLIDRTKYEGSLTELEFLSLSPEERKALAFNIRNCKSSTTHG